MNPKKFLAAFANYLVIVFVVATGWHLGLFKEVYANSGVRAEPLLNLGLLSMILQGLVMSYLYPIYYRGGSPATEGLEFGLLMGIFMGSYGALAEAGKFDVGSVSNFIFYEGAFFLLQFSLVGVAIGLVYGSQTRRT